MAEKKITLTESECFIIRLALNRYINYIKDTTAKWGFSNSHMKQYLLDLYEIRDKFFVDGSI